MDKYGLHPEEFISKHWEEISVVFPYKDLKQCEHRWLFIQKKKGTKVKWSDVEDNHLRRIIEEDKIKGW